MTETTQHKSSWRQPVKLVAFSFVLVTVAGLLALAVAEIVLRTAPIPGVSFHTFYYDELTGGRFYPNTVLIYRSPAGETVRRRVNSFGYLDLDRTASKPDNTYRIGFFGDSFTESRQVQIEETFHQSIAARLTGSSGGKETIECIAISMSGYGTLQSYLEYERWADSLALDMAVYVFCENDPDDQVPAIKRSDAIPYPIVDEEGLGVDNTFRVRHARKKGRLHRMWQFLKSHTMVFSTLEGRLKLLKARGVKLRVTEDDMHMGGAATSGGLPYPGALPSSWPDSLRGHAMTLCETVILHWRDRCRADGRPFAIAYIPRQAEMHSPRSQQDAWAPWLFGMCEREGVAISDPTARFLDIKEAGGEAYFDHLTRQGHEAVAEEFVVHFEQVHAIR